jgi:chaperone modulatory protein CbpM
MQPGGQVQRMLRPVHGTGPVPVLSDLNVARLCLICDLRHDLAVEEETMPLVLSLLGQI